MMRKLEIGYKNGFEVRHETISGAITDNIRIMHVTDLHLTGRSVFMLDQLTATIADLDPHVILLGGDYVDSRRGLDQLSALLKNVTTGRRVIAIPGNHDRFLWSKKIKDTFLNNDVLWLDERSTNLMINETSIQIDGVKPSTLPITSNVSILLLHKPIDISPWQHKYHLALAGHLHGCQVVLCENEKGLYPGRLFYTWNILTKQMGQCLYLVSKGLGDTVPIRYNCPKDIILITIIKTPTL